MADYNVQVTIPNSSTAFATASVGGTPGPQGPIGPSGVIGPVGPVGPSGFVNTGQLDLRYVGITGNQSIQGNKSFVLAVTAPNLVYRTGDQNIQGHKRFLDEISSPNLIYTTGDQIKSGRLIIGNDVGSIVDPNSPYTLSLQTNSPQTWLEILNNSGTNKGVFFGIQDNDFEQYNWQGGDVKFFTSENPSNGTERLTIKNNGKVGIGTNSPSEKLEVAGNIKAFGASFNYRPTVNGTGVLLSGEAAGLPNTLVYTTGNQTINGVKTFADTGSFDTIQITNKKLSSYNYINSNFIFDNTYINIANSSNNIIGTLPSGITSGINYYVKNLNTGILLITGSGQRTIDGFSNINLYKNESLQLLGVNNVGYTGWVTLSADNGVS
jgi:hypothetical protein